jgi:3-isopropylmalate dehydratase small subunit
VRQPGRVVVTSGHVDAEDDPGAAVVTLRRLGVVAVIGRSFAPAFARAAIDIGLPVLVIEETDAVCPGDRLRIDLEQHKIANLSSGDRYIVRNLDDAALELLRAGGGRAYEARRRAPTTGSRA